MAKKKRRRGRCKPYIDRALIGQALVQTLRDGPLGTSSMYLLASHLFGQTDEKPNATDQTSSSSSPLLPQAHNRHVLSPLVKRRKFTHVTLTCGKTSDVSSLKMSDESAYNDKTSDAGSASDNNQATAKEEKAKAMTTARANSAAEGDAEEEDACMRTESVGGRQTSDVSSLEMNGGSDSGKSDDSVASAVVDITTNKNTTEASQPKEGKGQNGTTW